MTKKEPITKKPGKEESEIEALTRMVANGFTHMEEYIDERFEAIDARFEAVDARFEAIDARFDAVDVRFDRLEDRVDSIGKTLDEASELLHSIVVPTLDIHDHRIKKLEKASAA